MLVEDSPVQNTNWVTKNNLNKFKMIEIISSIFFSAHDRIKLERIEQEKREKHKYLKTKQIATKKKQIKNGLAKPIQYCKVK